MESGARSDRRWLVLTAAWAAAEATVWPIMPDALLAPLAAARPRAWWGLALAATAGSLGGGLLSHGFGQCRPVEPLLARLPLVRPAMVAAADVWLAAEGSAGLRHHPLSGVPYKVCALLAGARRLPLGPFLAWSAAVRGARLLAIGGLAALLGRALGPRLAPLRWPLLLLWSGVFLAGLVRMVRTWERRGGPGGQVR